MIGSLVFSQLGVSCAVYGFLFFLMTLEAFIGADPFKLHDRGFLSLS